MVSLGIDIGTQSLKAAVLADDLIVLAQAQRPYRPSYPRPGWAEQSPDLWLSALRPVIGEALASAGLGPADVASVAICGQLDGCVPVDREGSVLASAIIWMDRRATAEIVDIDSELVSQRCGLVLDATHMAAKIRWLARHSPERSRIARWHQPVSYVVSALTGEAYISHSLASTTMLYDLETRDWHDSLLNAFEIDRRTLPTIADEVAIAGQINEQGAGLTGLRAGTPVAVGTGDDFSNPLGCGVCKPGIVAVSLGTAETVAALSARPVFDTELLAETHAYPGGQYHLGNPGWLSGGAVRWASALLSISNDEAFSALAATAPGGCDGLTFIPALTGAMAPKWIANARGSFIGLSTTHGPSHMARAVLEGTAFAMRDVVDRLAELSVPTDRLRLMGGGAQSDVWCDIRSCTVNRPADIQADGDASAVGAGILAAVASGAQSDITTAAASLRTPLREVLPDSGTIAVYEDAYGLYRERFAALEPIWRSETKT